jgi:hypothetical protein
MTPEDSIISERRIICEKYDFSGIMIEFLE